MPRVIAAVIFLTLTSAFLRHQFNAVMEKATAKSPPSSTFANSRFAKPQESRIKCIWCNGTGRSAAYNFPGATQQSKVCSNCHGNGWVDNPAYGQ